MGVASLVLGIVSIVVAWIPCVQYVAVIPTIVGLILGIVDAVQKNKTKEPKGMAIAGIVLNAIALVLIFIVLFVVTGTLFAAAATTA